jgi:hypothetical protein
MSLEDLMTYANWVVEFGQNEDALMVLGRLSDPASAAGEAQRHFDVSAEGEPRAWIVFDPAQSSGDYCCANAWYRISEPA